MDIREHRFSVYFVRFQLTFFLQLSESVTSGSNEEWYLQQLISYFQSIGYASVQSHQLGIATMIQQIQAEANVLAFQNAFFVSIILGLLSVIPALFLYQNLNFPVKLTTRRNSISLNRPMGRMVNDKADIAEGRTQ
ncbi:hypothetical protein skT53_34500 [Effusibacillus dendaii]|uniref:Uncharacterized protein n=1 Tax=Effusibacillus dendaii TaxID=2743772 RepID=A0A7I8DEI5_9BACL|nr:hypothetical protein skT53_34500 [Effusibacillus dendaii]